jgi:hypothetical protein
MTNFAPLYSQPQGLNPSPSHSQEPQVLHQAWPPTHMPKSSPYDPKPPSSAPETYSERSEPPAVSLSQMLPPKRVLPFPSKNPKLPPSDPEVITIRPSQATTEILPSIVAAAKKKKPRPKITKKKTVAPNKARGPQTADTSATTQPPGLAETPINPDTIYVPSTPEAAPSSRNVVSPISLSSPKGPTDSHLGATSPSSAQPKKRLKVTQTPQTGNNPLRAFADTVEPAEFMSRLDTWVREYHQTLPCPKPPSPPAQTASDTLALYAAQSKEDRMAAIDEMICECLADASFGKLVEDVEDSWKRIGLGF